MVMNMLVNEVFYGWKLENIIKVVSVIEED